MDLPTLGRPTMATKGFAMRSLRLEINGKVDELLIEN